MNGESGAHLSGAGTYLGRYGRSAYHIRTVEPLLRQGAHAELDGRRPVDDLADAIERLVLMP